MTRRITALATALVSTALLAIAAPAVHAQSNVTILGVLDVFGGTRQLAGAPHVSRVDSGGLTTSRWGFEGNEDLGGGLKAQFSMTGFLRVDTGETGRNATDAFWQRYAFVGLQGSFGTARFGRQTTPTFLSSIRFNPFGESISFSPYMLHMNGAAQPLVAPINSLDSAASNSITYTTPNFNGLSASGLYSLGETPSDGQNRWSGGATYETGPFAVSLTTEHSKIPGQFAATARNEINTQGGTTYDFGVAKLYGQYSRTTYSLIAGGERKYNTYQLGTSVPVGLDSVLLSYAHSKKNEPLLADVTRRTVALGYDYALSKRTDVYAVALNDRVSRLTNGNSVVAGMRHRF